MTGPENRDPFAGFVTVATGTGNGGDLAGAGVVDSGFAGFAPPPPRVVMPTKPAGPSRPPAAPLQFRLRALVVNGMGAGPFYYQPDGSWGPVDRALIGGAVTMTDYLRAQRDRAAGLSLEVVIVPKVKPVKKAKVAKPAKLPKPPKPPKPAKKENQP